MNRNPARARAVSRVLLPLVLFAGASGAALAAEKIVLAVCEGTFSGASPAELVDKYRPVADVIGKALKSPVVISPVCDFKRLESGIKEDRFDFVMARPSDYSARAIRDSGYRSVAQVVPDVSCVYVVPKDSPLKSLAEVKGKKVALPDKSSYMGQLCIAELRDNGCDAANKAQFVKEQAVVMYQLKEKNVDVGGMSSHSKAVDPKALEKAGLRELGRSRPQPYFPVIASRRMTDAQVDAVRKELLGLSESPAGQAVLAKAGLGGYAPGSEQKMKDLLTWLEKK
ncbi:MAG: phosphate/phosphite/phosphonate ABC transporter substrate-binding protein [Lysobacter sp.]|nr:phosphate/phosphite/phosphonate ABC transporter substrate-binding protein [Lysobacter sp.]